ncbi:MAG: HEAT repeat domain-containing protein, partial [Verrucomicrobiota bacterium]
DVHQKREHDDTLPALALVMGNAEQSIPHLQKAFQNADDPNIRINFARILAILGDRSGAEVLQSAVGESSQWGMGWDFSSQREKANSFGSVDRLVIALGFLQTPEVVPSLVQKLELLDAESPLSHYKAICLALRLNKHALLREPLAHLLNKPGVKGHAQPLNYYVASGGKTQQRFRVNAQGGAELNAKFKEVLLAALLFECGDYQSQGREILEGYRKDVNGHFAAMPITF